MDDEDDEVDDDTKRSLWFIWQAGSVTYNPNFLVRDYDGAAAYTLSFAAGNNSNRLVSGGEIFNK